MLICSMEVAGTDGDEVRRIRVGVSGNRRTAVSGNKEATVSDDKEAAGSV